MSLQKVRIAAGPLHQWEQSKVRPNGRGENHSLLDVQEASERLE